MGFTMTGAVTGGAQTGFTTPGYVLTADLATDVRSKQSVVTGTSGTQTGVVVHSVNAPFTVTVRRPGILRTASQAFVNGITGKLSKVPYNEYTILVRKAAQVALDQWWTNEWRGTCRIAAGSETYDAANVRAGASLFAGFVSTNSAAFGDTAVSGTI